MPLHIKTPLLESRAFSAKTNMDVRLKLESVQPCGSFKLRGIGLACEAYLGRGARRFVASSGGNAGYAVAYAGRKLGVPVMVVVPETTSERAKALIRSEAAEVVVHGASWAEANDFAHEVLTPDDRFIHPFDDPLLWQGHSTLVEELQEQGDKPDVIICSVGGGGLLCGVVEGLQKAGWGDVGVVAVETEGAASYAAALAAGAPVTIPEIRTVATSLGARAVCERAVTLAASQSIASCVVSDEQAVRGSLELLDEHRLLTEPACGASVFALQRVVDFFPQARRVTVVVCGGVGTTAEQLRQWQSTVGR
jgi:L-serine/L-threonine ammonia-lyase